jgi:hypothetical protein
MINLHSVEGIKKAVDDGYTVCDGSDIYQVKKVDDGYIIKNTFKKTSIHL